MEATETIEATETTQEPAAETTEAEAPVEQAEGEQGTEAQPEAEAEAEPEKPEVEQPKYMTQQEYQVGMQKFQTELLTKLMPMLGRGQEAPAQQPQKAAAPEGVDPKIYANAKSAFDTVIAHETGGRFKSLSDIVSLAEFAAQHAASQQANMATEQDFKRFAKEVGEANVPELTQEMGNVYYQTNEDGTKQKIANWDPTQPINVPPSMAGLVAKARMDLKRSAKIADGQKAGVAAKRANGAAADGGKPVKTAEKKIAFPAGATWLDKLRIADENS